MELGWADAGARSFRYFLKLALRIGNVVGIDRDGRGGLSAYFRVGHADLATAVLGSMGGRIVDGFASFLSGDEYGGVVVVAWVCQESGGLVAGADGRIAWISADMDFFTSLRDFRSALYDFVCSGSGVVGPSIAGLDSTAACSSRDRSGWLSGGNPADRGSRGYPRPAGSVLFGNGGGGG